MSKSYLATLMVAQVCGCAMTVNGKTSNWNPFEEKPNAAPAAAPTATQPASAAKSEPPAATKSTDNSLRCSPSCYPAEAKAAGTGAQTTGCGYTTFRLSQDATIAGWGPIYVENPTVSTIPAACAFPRAGGAKAALAAEAKKLLGEEVEATDVVFIPADAMWEQTRTTTNGVQTGVGRNLYGRRYSKKLEFKTNECGSQDERVRCETSKNGTPILALNVGRYRLDEAAKLKKLGSHESCQAAARAAFQVTNDILSDADDYFQWLPIDGLYKTRYDGQVTEAQLKKRLATYAKQARETFTSCGGKGEIAAGKIDDLLPQR